MTQPSPIPSEGRIVDAMVQLAHATKSHRMVVAGSNSAEVIRALLHRGYPRVTTTRTCRVPCGQYDVALVAWREHSIKALEPSLAGLVQFLGAAGVLVVWVGPNERISHQTVRLALDRLGFRIESGTCCENGVAISARRLMSIPAVKVA